MKKILVFGLLLSSWCCFGQTVYDDADSIAAPKNKGLFDHTFILKGDLTKPILAAANGYAGMGFGIEVYFGRRSSFQITGYGTHTNTITTGIRSETREKTNTRSFFFDYRIYLQKATAPTGMYMGPYLSLNSISTEQKVYAHNTLISLGFPSEFFMGGGGQFGYQAKITSRFYVDFNSRIGLNPNPGAWIFGNPNNESRFNGFFDLSLLLAFRL